MDSIETSESSQMTLLEYLTCLPESVYGSIKSAKSEQEIRNRLKGIRGVSPADKFRKGLIETAMRAYKNKVDFFELKEDLRTSWRTFRKRRSGFYSIRR